MQYLTKDLLQEGKSYFCKARNFKIGTWNGEAFEYMRSKCGSRFRDREYHWDDGPPFGTVKPFKEAYEDKEQRTMD